MDLSPSIEHSLLFKHAALAERISHIPMQLQENPDRRRFQRFKVPLLGRYMLGSKQEYPCQTSDISIGGCLLIAPKAGKIGEKIIIYLESIGRIEAQLVRTTPIGFAVVFNCTQHKRDKIADVLTWLINKDDLVLGDIRRHERIVPKSTGTTVVLKDGLHFSAEVLDISLSGAAVSTDAAPALKDHVVIGSTHGIVVRLFTGGFAVEFTTMLGSDAVDEDVVL